MFQVFDEESGNIAQIDVYGRLTQFEPVLDLNGGEVDGIDYALTFREDQDSSLQIVDDDVFITDEDIDPQIVSITVNITNPQLDTSLEFLSLSQDAPEEIDVSGENTHVVVLSLHDPSLATTRDFFITTLLRLRYSNIADELGGEERVIEFTVSDGQLTNDPIAVTTISIVEVDDVPVLDLNGEGEPGTSVEVKYTEADPPTLIAADAVIEDPDSPLLTQMTIEFEPFDEGDESIAVDLGILSPGSGITCNLSPCNGTSLDLSGEGVKDDYQSLLRTLAYVNVKQPQELPNLRDRIITVQVKDSQSLSVAGTEIVIDFLANQSRVIIQLDIPNQDYFTEYTEGQSQSISVVGDQIRIVDTSLVTLQSVDLTIRSNLPGGVREADEDIFINTAQLAGLEIGVEIHAVLKRITFSGEAPLEDYLTAIRHVMYRNREDEPDPMHRFIDFVVDPGGGAPRDFAFTNITIININDHSPLCSPQLQTVLVREDTQPVSLIHTLTATDADVGVGSVVKYEQISGDNSLFSTLSSGAVNLIGTLDFEDVKSYTVGVEACDNGIVPNQFCCDFTLQVNVTDFNDEEPVFSEDSYTLSVAENTVTDITTFIITDDDSGTNAEIVQLEIVTSSYVPVSGCMGLFAVTANPPTLSTVAPGLDYEMRNSCQFIVTATDGGGVNALTGSATITINVLNEDDFPPEFSQNTFQFSVVEDNSFPLVIGQVEAQDIDSDSFIYSLQDAPGFSINGMSGHISILFSTDYDTATDHTFECVATDPSSNNATTQVLVRVTPINNDPPTLDLNATDTDSDDALTPVLFVEESGLPVSLVTDPVITDPDPPQVPLIISEIRVRVANAPSPSEEVLSLSSSVTSLYTDMSPADGSALVIEPASPTQLDDVYNLIQSIEYTNLEDEISQCDSSLHLCALGSNSRTILIQVRDGVNYSPEREVYVIFEAVNDAPEIDLNTVASGTGFRTVFQEGQGAVHIVNLGSVSISDDDDAQLTELHCNLTNPVDGTDEFLVLSGIVPSELTAAVSPNGYTITINGTASVPSYVAAISLIVYNSTTSNPSDDLRKIECHVSDGIAVSDVATAEVVFDTVNEMPILDLDSLSPTVNYSTGYIEEGGPVVITGDVVLADIDDTTMSSLTVTLLDAQSSEERVDLNPTYSLPPPLSITTSASGFIISGSESILVYRNLISNIVYNNTASEISDVSTRTVEFIIQDDGGAASEPAHTSIYITPIDDNPPMFEEVPEDFEIFENTTNATQVGVLSVIDLDQPSGSDIPSFSITTDSQPAFGTSDFYIVNNPDNLYEGIIRVSNDSLIDFDDRAANYSLVILASSGGFNTTITVTVAVINVPDLDPIFTTFPSTIEVSENEVVNTPLTSSVVLAIDPDNLDTIEYDITGNELGGVPLIDIDSETGVLTVVGGIDREIHGAGFNVTITARDSNSMASEMARVVILGMNEFAPSFTAPTYLAQVTENETPDSEAITTVSASDVDAISVKQNIMYSIRNGSGSDLFEINSTSGDIFQLLSVDYEEFSTITLVVEANDNDDTPSPLTSTALVEISVSNINDEAPYFDNLPSSINVPELTTQHTAVFSVEFGDPDINSDLRFSSLHSDVFAINSVTGEITVSMASLDADQGQREYAFLVELTDRNTDPVFSSVSVVTAELNITIEDVNDIVPVFSSAGYEGEVMENLAPGQSAVQVTAADGDYGLTPSGTENGNNIVEYLLGTDAPEGVFSINNETGLVITEVSLNREEQAEYVFTVIARDSPANGSPNYHTTQVRVTVTDVNEHPPSADPSQYYIFVEENTQPFLQTYVSSQWTTEGIVLAIKTYCM